MEMALGIIGLIICVSFTKIGSDRFYVAQVALLVYVLNVVVSLTWVGNAFELANFFAFQSLFNLLVIVCLSFVMSAYIGFSKVAILVMILNIFAISLNAMGYWLDINGYSQNLHYYLTIALYLLEVLILLSKRLTDGIYGSLSKLAVFCRATGIIDTYCIKNGQRK